MRGVCRRPGLALQQRMQQRGAVLPPLLIAEVEQLLAGKPRFRKLEFTAGKEALGNATGQGFAGRHRLS